MPGPVIFILHITTLSHIIQKHSVNHELFADDTQLCKSGPPTGYVSMVLSLKQLTAEFKNWTFETKRKLNEEK